jgi:hypothetical protein
MPLFEKEIPNQKKKSFTPLRRSSRTNAALLLIGFAQLNE